MNRRDKTSATISKAGGNEKITLLAKYKAQRNKVTSRIRAENIKFIQNRIKNAKDENEIWNVDNDVISPNKENNFFGEWHGLACHSKGRVIESAIRQS